MDGFILRRCQWQVIDGAEGKKDRLRLNVTLDSSRRFDGGRNGQIGIADVSQVSRRMRVFGSLRFVVYQINVSDGDRYPWIEEGWQDGVDPWVCRLAFEDMNTGAIQPDDPWNIAAS